MVKSLVNVAAYVIKFLVSSVCVCVCVCVVHQHITYTWDKL